MPVVGGARLVITGAAGAGLIVMENGCVATGLTPLLAVTVPVNAPLLVGVPEMTPVVLKLKPVGKLPEVTLNVGTG